MPTDKLVSEIITLQERISIRLAELGYADRQSASKISRHLAEIAVLGRAFADNTLPLFLTLGDSHEHALSQLSISMKCDLEELQDALTDVDRDMHELMHFLQRGEANEHPE